MIIYVLLIFGLAGKVLPYRCAYPTGPQSTTATLQPASNLRHESDHERIVNDGTKLNFSVISTSIDINETLCYNIEVPYYSEILDAETRDQYQYRIKLVDIEEVYKIKEAYNFSIPKADVSCWCDCPGLMDTCNSGTNTCQGSNTYEDVTDTCVMFHSGNQNSVGCTFSTGSTELCCAVRIEPITRNGNLYTALNIQSPYFVATYKVELFSVRLKKVTYSTLQKIDLTHSHTFFSKFPVLLHLPSNPTPVLQNGQYFFPSNGKSKELYSGVEMNDINEWSMNKLGWLRHDGIRYKINKAVLRQAISSSVERCGSNEVSFNMDAKFLNYFPYKAKNIIPTVQHKIISFHRSEKYISFKLKQFPRIDAVVTFEGLDKILLRQDDSYFTSYTAQINILSSGATVKITFSEIAGSIEGVYLQSNNSTVKFRQYFFLYVPEHSRFFEKVVSVSEKGCDIADNFSREVCVRAITTIPYKCTPIPCVDDNIIPTDKIGESTAIIEVRTWDKVPRWTLYLNPLQWFNGFSSWMEFCVMVCSIFLVVMTAIFIKKIIISINKFKIARGC